MQIFNVFHVCSPNPIFTVGKVFGDLVILSSMLSYHRLRLIVMFVQLGQVKLIAGRNHDSAEDLCARFTMRK